jgi:hypothetical protein
MEVTLPVVSEPDCHGWKVRHRTSGHEMLAELVAYWELEGEAISEDYTPENMSAADLLALWFSRYGNTIERGLIPIYWFVSCSAHGIFESMPFQHAHVPQVGENFLTHYVWPVDPKTGVELNWLTLPVVDKCWNRKQAAKGGFIQEATGWKPGILQPFVALKSLLQAST